MRRVIFATPHHETRLLLKSESATSAKPAGFAIWRTFPRRIYRFAPTTISGAMEYTHQLLKGLITRAIIPAEIKPERGIAKGFRLYLKMASSNNVCRVKSSATFPSSKPSDLTKSPNPTRRHRYVNVRVLSGILGILRSAGFKPELVERSVWGLDSRREECCVPCGT